MVLNTPVSFPLKEVKYYQGSTFLIKPYFIDKNNESCVITYHTIMCALSSVVKTLRSDLQWKKRFRDLISGNIVSLCSVWARLLGATRVVCLCFQREWTFFFQIRSKVLHWPFTEASRKKAMQAFMSLRITFYLQRFCGRGLHAWLCGLINGIANHSFHQCSPHWIMTHTHTQQGASGGTACADTDRQTHAQIHNSASFSHTRVPICLVVKTFVHRRRKDINISHTQKDNNRPQLLLTLLLLLCLSLHTGEHVTQAVMSQLQEASVS